VLINELGRNVALDGGTGDDILQSDDAFATFTGGAGEDAFVVATNPATGLIFPRPLLNFITDFEPGTDHVIVRISEDDPEADYQFIDDGGDALLVRIETNPAQEPYQQVARLTGVSPDEVSLDDVLFLTDTEVEAMIASQGADGYTLPGVIDPPLSGATPNDDTLIGTSANDAIDALAGNDLVEGAGGNDTLLGNTGADTLLGGPDDDLLFTGTDPIIYDNSVNFPMDRGLEDNAFGGVGDDTLIAGQRDATLFGGEDNDLLVGGLSGVQVLDGGAGDDTLIGTRADTVYQTITNAILESSRLIGGAGNDVIYTADDYSATGGAGNDTFIVTNGTSAILQILDFNSAEDVLVLPFDEGTEPPAFEDLRYRIVPEFFRLTYLGSHLEVGVNTDRGGISWLARIDNLGSDTPVSPNGFTYPSGTEILPESAVSFATQSEIGDLLGYDPITSNLELARALAVPEVQSTVDDIRDLLAGETR
jgi:Ca2+-binding RTX toxin-like protein